MSDERTAIITGASSGIGEACARAFARDGLHVVLAARRADRLERVAADIRAAGGRATAIVCDVTDATQVDHLVAEALAITGRLDVMVCNAGLGFNGRLDETSADQMRRLMDVNYFGTFHAARAAITHFRQQGHGHVFIVSSIVGRRGIARMGAYAATKFAQVGLGEALRSEVAGTPIHVTIVYPVSTETEFRAAVAREWGQQVSGTGPRQSPEVVAKTMSRALRRPRPEIYPMPNSKALSVLAVVAPRFVDRLVRRFARTSTP